MFFRNNWVEIRLDAKKLVDDSRRPLAQRASNIGIIKTIIKIHSFFIAI
jgi:hypothetical protein